MYLPTLRRRFAVHTKYAKNVTPNAQNKRIEAAKRESNMDAVTDNDKI